MVAQEWVGSKLESSVYFEPDEQGLDLFAAYLKSFRNEPIRLLVDLIEEEFRQIRIPLLRGSDRKAILERNFSKYFRNSRYRFAISQSVEKKTRKEEKLLLIGLTNQELLEPWLKIVDETKTALSGIVSLPLISEEYVKGLKSESRVIILVSQQVPSNLRQSVFVDGRLILSRLVPIASFYQGDYATDVLRDIESTQRYLISQRIVERTEQVEVHVLTNTRHLQKLAKRGKEDQFFDFHVMEINELLAAQKVEIRDDQDFSSGLFCFLASKKFAVNHYAQQQEKRYYQHHKVSLGLKVAGIALLTLGLGLGATGAVKGLLYSTTINETVAVEQKYSAKFNQLSERRVDPQTSTSTMQKIVQSVNEIEKKFLHDPEDMMSLVSQNISLFNDIRVKKLEWFLTNDPYVNSASGVNWEKTGTKRRKQGEEKRKKISKKALFEVAIVEGEFLEFDGNYRYALSVVDDLEKTMNESGAYFLVKVIKRPLDIESDNRLSGNIGIQSAAKAEVAKVTFKVVREVTVK